MYPLNNLNAIPPLVLPPQVAEQLAPYIDSGCRLFNLKVCTQAPEEEVDLGGEVLSALSKMRQDQT